MRQNRKYEEVESNAVVENRELSRNVPSRKASLIDYPLTQGSDAIYWIGNRLVQIALLLYCKVFSYSNTYWLNSNQYKKSFRIMDSNLFTAVFRDECWTMSSLSSRRNSYKEVFQSAMSYRGKKNREVYNESSGRSILKSYLVYKCPRPDCAKGDVSFLEGTGFKNPYSHLRSC